MVLGLCKHCFFGFLAIFIGSFSVFLRFIFVYNCMHFAGFICAMLLFDDFNLKLLSYCDFNLKLRRLLPLS